MDRDDRNSWAFTPITSLPTPSSIPYSHITLLDDFFRTVDMSSKNPDASQSFVSIFTEDGTWKTPSATFSGTKELTESGHTWGFFKMVQSMRHRVLRVYVNDEQGRHLMLLGTVRSEMLDGETVLEQQFGARVEIEESSSAEGDTPRLKFFQGWSSQQ